MDPRVQRLDTAINDLGKTGVITDTGHFKPVIMQQLLRATGTQQRVSKLQQLAGKINQASFVRNAKQGEFIRLRYQTNTQQEPGLVIFSVSAGLSYSRVH